MSVNEFLGQLMHYALQQGKGFSIVEMVIYWLIVIVVMHLCIVVKGRITGNRVDWHYEALWGMVLLYASFVGQITIFRRTPGTNSSVYLDFYLGSINGGFYGRQQMFYSILNVLLFVPWGFLLGLCRRKSSIVLRGVMVTCYSFLTSIFIESVQFIAKRGHFEINDIVTNTVGGFIGAVIAIIVSAIFTKGRKCYHERQTKKYWTFG
jgi:glycopeptide antibiotics resistance protein